MLTDARGNYLAGQYCLLHYPVSTKMKLMTVCIEESRNVWNVITSRSETRNTMNPECADALLEAFLEFEKGEGAVVDIF